MTRPMTTRSPAQKDKKSPSDAPVKMDTLPPTLDDLGKVLPADSFITVPIGLFRSWDAQRKEEGEKLTLTLRILHEMKETVGTRLLELRERVEALEQQQKGAAPRAARQRKKK